MPRRAFATRPGWLWLFLAVGVGCPGGFVLGGVRIPIAEWGRVVSVPVDPLGGGDHGRRRCPPKVPGQRMSSTLYKELDCLSRGIVMGVLLRPHRGSLIEPACSGWGRYCTSRSQVAHQAGQVSTDSLSLPVGHLKGVQGQVGAHCPVGGPPPHDPPREARQSRKPHRPTPRKCARRRGYLPRSGGMSAGPQLVRPENAEMPFDEVGRALVLKAPSGSSWAT